MVASVANNGATRLLDLPNEILQMIFREAYKRLRLGCKYSGTSDQTALITYPSVLLVSKCFYAMAKAAAIEEGTVDLGGPRFNFSGNLCLSPSFHLVQHLEATGNNWDPWQAKATEAVMMAIKAATQLKTLHLNIGTIYLPHIRAHGWPLRKEARSRSVSRWGPQRLSRASKPTITFWIVQEWKKRDRAFEICMEMVLKANPTPTDEHHHRFWNMVFSTRTNNVAFMPGKDNRNPMKDDSEFDMTMDPGYLESLFADRKRL
ncbi:uncharacterized protein AB675_7282 [Cyphellophora attinorum]|uniref:F-box domain-containing protein n=1 Tax=Cyphellophora attinorum TaxID=1664694 RepID=A0A0N0NIU7_9EURO|nr:uncharacterized protein AB675_7282 [Phialophora attinorum]KPI36241.1 hypothetical protein AB675_7282 [Phialophora attinorum]